MKSRQRQDLDVPLLLELVDGGGDEPLLLLMTDGALGFRVL